MVPPHHAPPRSRCRILRLDHIQRSRRDRAIYCSRLYARDKSRLNDNVAGQPSILHSLAYESEQFRRQCQPELFALSRHYERYDRVEPQLLISPYRRRSFDDDSVNPSISTAEHVHYYYRWNWWKAQPQRYEYSEGGPSSRSRFFHLSNPVFHERYPRFSN